LKNLRKILILLITLLIILVVFIVIKKHKKNYTENYNENQNMLGSYETEQITIKKVDNPRMYFTVKSCVEKYIDYLSDKNFSIIYKLLDHEYIQKHSITEANVKDYVEEVYEMSSLEIDEMYVEKIDDNNEIYYINAILREIIDGEEIQYGENKNCALTIKINHSTMTFTVIPFGHGGVFDE